MILFYLIYCVFNDLLAYYLFKIVKVGAYIVYDIFTVIEFGLFSLFFSYIVKEHGVKRTITSIFIVFAIFSIIDYFFLRKDESFNSTTAAVAQVLMISMCIYYFYYQLKQPDTYLIYNTQNFWIIIAFLIYVSGTFFLYLLAENMIGEKTFAKQYRMINSSFIILKNFFLFIAMLIKPQKPSTSDFSDEILSSDWENIQNRKNVN